MDEIIGQMLEREARREKILEARNREIRLKQKTEAQAKVEDEGGEGVEDEEGFEGEEVDMKGDVEEFIDHFVQQAEYEFYKKIISFLPKPPEPEEEENAEEEADEG